MLRNPHAALLICLGFLVACADDPPEDLKEWTPDDHNHRLETRSRRNTGAISKHSRPRRSPQIAGITWRNQCASCHGNKGRGDGPQGAMLKPKDLSLASWQDSVSDEDIAQIILKGKGKMPAFNLPESTVEELVKKIRRMRRRTVGMRAPEPSATMPESSSD